MADRLASCHSSVVQCSCSRSECWMVCSGQRGVAAAPSRQDSSYALSPRRTGASRMQADGAEGIPLWFYKMDTGRWQEEGRCLIKEDEQGKFCEGELAHFTSWNLDLPAAQLDCVRVKVTDSRSGTPLSGSEVILTADAP